MDSSPAPAAIVLRVGPDDLDVLRFERVLAQGTDARLAGEPARAAQLLRGALALWRGPPLADFSYEPFAQREIARLEELRLVALEERIDADLALGRHAQLVGDLDGLTRDHPLRERMRGQLMLALYRCGRQAEALSTYRDVARMLSDELGLEPGPALRELEAKVLEHSPELAPPAPGLRPTPAATSSGPDAGASEVAAPTSAAPSAAVGQRPGASGERPLLAFGRRHRVAMLTTGLALAAVVGVLVALRDDGSGVRVAGDALALVDSATGELTGSVSLGSRPGAVDADGREAWVTLPDRGAVVQVDAKNASVKDTVPVGADPSGIAVGAGSVWVANSGSSTVSRVSPARNSVVQIIDVPSSPAAIVIGRGGVWVASSGDDSVSRIDPGSGKVLATIGVGDQPVGLAVDDRGLWVANAASGTVTRVDPAGGRVVQSIDVGNGAQGIAAGPGGVWVANRLDGTVSRIDPDTNAVVQTIPVGRAPSGIALVAGSVWVSDESEGSVTRIARRSGDLTTFPLGSQAGNVALGGGALLVSVRGAETRSSRRHAYRRGARRAGLDRPCRRLLLGVLEHPGADERRSRGLQAGGRARRGDARPRPRAVHPAAHRRRAHVHVRAPAGHPLLRRLPRASAGLPPGDRADLHARVVRPSLLPRDRRHRGMPRQIMRPLAGHRGRREGGHGDLPPVQGRSRVPAPARAAVRVRGPCRHPGSPGGNHAAPSHRPLRDRELHEVPGAGAPPQSEVQRMVPGCPARGVPGSNRLAVGGRRAATRHRRPGGPRRPHVFPAPARSPGQARGQPRRTAPHHPAAGELLHGTRHRDAPVRRRARAPGTQSRASTARRSAGCSGRPGSRRARSSRRTSPATSPTAPTRDPISPARGSLWRRRAPRARG